MCVYVCVCDTHVHCVHVCVCACAGDGEMGFALYLELGKHRLSVRKTRGTEGPTVV